jgi:hypothetical protein
VIGDAALGGVSSKLLGALREDDALKHAGAAEAPFGGDELVDKDGLERIGGGEVGAEGCRVGLEIVGALGGDEELAGGESVLEGVEAGFGFAFRSTGASAVCGVGAIGFVLFICGGHGGDSAVPFGRGITRRGRGGGGGLRVSG